MTLLLLTLFAFAQPEPADGDDPAATEAESPSTAELESTPASEFPVDFEEEPQLPEEEPELSIFTAEQLTEDAVRRIRLADYPGARQLLDEAVERADANLEEVTYLRGVSYELDRDYDSALAVYTAGIEQFPAGTRRQDFAFRRAEVIGGLGDHERALDELKPFFAGLKERPHADQIKIRLVQATWLAETGKRRKALRLIADALEDAEEGEVTFYQAKARATVCRLWAEDAAALSLDAKERKQVKRLTERGETLAAIEKQVTLIALLKEPEWVLSGLLSLGQGYEAVGRDLSAVRAPKNLAPELHELYAQTVAERSEVVLVKALNHYQKGLELALELGWRSRRIGELEAARDALAAHLEANAPAPR